MKTFLSLLIVLIPYAYASDCPESVSKCNKASQLVTIFGYEESIKTYQNSCLDQLKAFSPDVIANKDKALFSGINIESPKWPKFLRAYEDYTREACGDAIRPLMLDAYRDAWAKNLTDQELSSFIAYLSSPDGRSLARAIPNIYKSVTHQTLPGFIEIGQQAWLHYAKSLRAIADEEANPASPKPARKAR